jgi:hypothetical protein|tara:strand:+ start:426 stop:782 length:357 start_codon:yes stop_codon:yes gene_type:complete
MASTRNKNDHGNYIEQQKMNKGVGEYVMYTNSSSAKAYSSYHPGKGLLPAKTAREELCNNYTDVESELFGIGSTNLVKPKEVVKPVYKDPKSINFIDGLEVYLPEPLVIEKNQRPYMN